MHIKAEQIKKLETMKEVVKKVLQVGGTIFILAGEERSLKSVERGH